MKKTSFPTLYLALPLLLLTLACKKETGNSTEEQLSRGAPPPICVTPTVTVSNYSGNGGTGSENTFLLGSGLNSPTAVTQSPTGDVMYVSTGKNIRKMYAGFVSTLITLPEIILCLATDQDGNIYAGAATTISKVSPSGVLLTTFGRLGEYGISNTPILRFSYVSGIAFDDANNMYVSESINRIIRKITPDGTATHFAGMPGPVYFDVPITNGPALEAKFARANGIAVNRSGTRVYVADEFAIRKIEGGMVSTIAGGTIGLIHHGIVDGNGLSARFFSLSGISIDANENLYVTDGSFGKVLSSYESNYYVRKISKMTTGLIAWKVFTLAGSSVGYANGTGTTAKFYNPQGIFVNPTATVGFVADLGNNRVRKLSFSCPLVF